MIGSWIATYIGSLLDLNCVPIGTPLDLFGMPLDPYWVSTGSQFDSYWISHDRIQGHRSTTQRVCKIWIWIDHSANLGTPQHRQPVLKFSDAPASGAANRRKPQHRQPVCKFTDTPAPGNQSANSGTPQQQATSQQNVDLDLGGVWEAWEHLGIIRKEALTHDWISLG